MYELSESLYQHYDNVFSESNSVCLTHMESCTLWKAYLALKKKLSEEEIRAEHYKGLLQGEIDRLQYEANNDYGRASFINHAIGGKKRGKNVSSN